MNSVNIAGKIIEEPVKATSSNGLPFAKFKINVDKNKDANGNGYDTYEIVVFRELAELKYEIGQFVAISGKLTTNNYDKEGKQYFNCSIVGNSISFMGK